MSTLAVPSGALPLVAGIWIAKIVLVLVMAKPRLARF